MTVLSSIARFDGFKEVMLRAASLSIFFFVLFTCFMTGHENTWILGVCRNMTIARNDIYEIFTLRNPLVSVT